ncbi:MdtA/MuxA family multidrug efflux RND transporter periplasmic adaptor subunit [Anatilimnocola sp. NA78]|uniref:MdtA/MuxA family multidrug efflux RND transporter periplasmic adaptor subunit n=1 Tax=Anatilimnocola sp. NA78 TaxID=3415683 RepID=UPI003CE4FC01
MIRNSPIAAAAIGEAPETTKRRPSPTAENPASPVEPTTAAPQPPANSSGRFWLVMLIVIAIGGGIGWYYQEQWWPRVAPYFGETKPETKPVRVVPVVTATVGQRDMDLYLNGLGTVTALKTVTIRSRVEGELINVAFVEGQMVKEGDLLAEIDSRPFEVQRDQAAGQLARDEATLKAAKVTLERLERLFRADSVSTQEVENQLAIVQQTEGAIKSDRAMVADAELQITYCRIESPIDGRIGLRLVDVGNIVRANEANGLAVINQLQPIALTFTISQDEIPRVRKRMLEGEELQVDAYDRDFTNKLASGKLIATDNQVDSTTGTLRLKAIIDHNADSLFPNQFVNTRLLVDTLPNAIVVPAAAVQRGPEFSFVYVVTSDDTVELRQVEIGPTEGSETVIEKGLAPGEIVVTEGIDKLQPKTKVSTRNAQPKAGMPAVGKPAEGKPADSKDEQQPDSTDRSKAAR